MTAIEEPKALGNEAAMRKADTAIAEILQSCTEKLTQAPETTGTHISETKKTGLEGFKKYIGKPA
jgi:hypothetical protein